MIGQVQTQDSEFVLWQVGFRLPTGVKYSMEIGKTNLEFPCMVAIPECSSWISSLLYVICFESLLI